MMYSSHALARREGMLKDNEKQKGFPLNMADDPCVSLSAVNGEISTKRFDNILEAKEQMED